MAHYIKLCTKCLMYRDRSAFRMFVLTLLLMTPLASSAQIFADKTSGCGNVIVGLRDEQPQNPAYTYEWDMGVTPTSLRYGWSQSYTFSTPGTYNVVLRIKNSAGNILSTWSQAIVVHPPPNIDFGADDLSGCFPHSVNFTDNSTPGNGAIIFRRWVFGDGNTVDNVTNPTHVYRNLSGNFPVTLRVIQNSCPQDTFTITKSAYINVSQGVQPDFIVEPPTNCAPPIQIRIVNNTRTGPGQNLSYEWTFQSGSPNTSTVKDPTVEFGAAGTYEVHLKATSDQGCTDEIKKTVVIPASSLNTDFVIINPKICVGQIGDFMNNSSPAPDQSTWYIGSDPGVNSINLNKQFTTPGIYNVRLVNKFGTCEQEITKTIEVVGTPPISLNSPNRTNCRAPHTVDFTYGGAAPSDIVSYTWEFGDGSQQTTNIPTANHLYNNVGSYPVAVSVNDRFGCTQRKIFNNFVLISPPQFSQLDKLFDSGCVGKVFNPQINIFAPDGVASYTWDFGDGGPGSSSATPSHVYNAPSNPYYPVRLRVRTNTGCDTTTTGAVWIGTQPGTPDFSAAQTNLCAGDTARFSSSFGSSPAVTGWFWQFGDGGTATSPNPGYPYNDIGKFTVRLTVFNNGCASNVESKANYMNIRGARATFIYTIDCVDRKRINFVNTSSDAEQYDWDFGDGTQLMNVRHPGSHIFPGLDTFPVVLTVTEAGCVNKQTLNVVTFDEPAKYTTSYPFGATTCTATNLVFTAVDSDPDNIRQYEWDFGDGNFIIGNRSESNTYPGIGVYNPRLRITDKAGCQKTYAGPPLGLGGPSPDFDAPLRQGCVGLVVNFTDNSTFSGSNNIVSRAWDFGDGTTYMAGPAETSVSHTYTSPGSRTVILTVTDVNGCTETRRLLNYVTITEPTVSLSASELKTCPGAPVQFTSSKSSGGGIFTWEFGDGKTGTNPSPVHIFTAPGKYTVKLKVRDFAGCISEDEKIEYIQVESPTADFDLSQDFSNCPPLSPTFTYKGTFEKSIKWEFGDGAVSDLRLPTQVYLYPGTYNAKLIVTSPGGCTAEKTKQIQIRGPLGRLEFLNDLGCDNLQVNFRVTNDSDVDEVIWDTGESTQITKTRSITYTFSKPGTYIPRITLKNNAGCTIAYPTGRPIKVVGITPDFSSTTAIFCEKGTATFTNNSTSNGTISRYLWEFGDGKTSTDPNPTNTYTSAGAYPVTLKVFTAEGCEKPVTKPSFIVVSNKPDPDITGGNAVCQEGSLQFTGRELPVTGPPSPVTWFWDFGNGNTSTDPNPPPQTFRAAGPQRVVLTLTNSYGCIGTETKNITIHPLPSTDAGPDQTICLNSPVMLTATGANTYAWKSPATGLSCTNCAQPLANPSLTTKYYVTGTSAQGCSWEDSVNITVIQPSTVSTKSLDTICVGQSIQLKASGTAQYRWSPSSGLNNPNIPNPIATPSTTTTYTVTGSDLKNCFTSTQTATITVLPYPSVTLGSGVTVPVGTPVPLNPTVGGTGNQYLWTPASGLSCVNCLNPIALPKVTTSYKLTVTNAGGCSSSDAITITVLCGAENLFMPNTFSPNGDGSNDLYYPRGKGIQTVRSLRIFNRWGEMVYRRDNFRPNDPSSAWDGRFQGRELPPDVFVYMIDVVCENQSIVTLKGDIALIR